MSTGKIEKLPESEYPYPIKSKFYLEPEERVESTLPGEGEIKVYEGPISTNEKEIFGQMLKEIAEKDNKVKDLLKDNDYEILEVIRSKPVTTKTETGYTSRVETATVVLEKESTGEKYWITIDLGTNAVKSIEKE